MNIRWSITAILSAVVWLKSPGFCSELPEIVESMGSSHDCEQYPSEVHWISDKTTAIVIGKNEDSSRTCRLKFGLATTKPDARLRLSFDFIYNHACGVYLQINESATKDFNSKTNREMYFSGCNTKDPGPLYAQPRHFVMVSLLKENVRLEAYNFRLNISMAEHLPIRGPELHMVIIVGFILFIVVILAAVLLFKYVTRLSYRWHEQHMEELLARPVNLYTSQEPLEESSHVYTRLAGRGGQPSVEYYASGSQVVFSHPNGRIKRLYPQNGAHTDSKEFSNRNVSRLNSNNLRDQHVVGREQNSASCQPVMFLESDSAPCLGTDFGDTVSLGGCDIPPSYEEALRMPLAGDVETGIDEYGLGDVAAGEGPDVNCFTVDIVEGDDSRKCKDGGSVDKDSEVHESDDTSSLR